VRGANGRDTASAGFSGRAAQNISARGNEASASSWDQRSNGNLNARSSESSASFGHRTDSESSFSDTSRYHHRLVVYADPTKKGAGATNEVRAKLGEMIKSAGLVTSFYDINLMGREFATEDALYHKF